MTVAATTRTPFAGASPAEIRAALVPEEQGEFDRQYRRSLEAAGASYSLDQLDKTLAAWRRVAWMTTAHGPEAYRRMLAKAEHTVRTGQSPAGSVPWDHVKAELGLQVAYTIDVDPEAREQIHALPSGVLTALAEAMTVLMLTPWNGDPINKENPDGAVRVLLFNPRGMITYLIVEDQRRVDVLQVTWAN